MLALLVSLFGSVGSAAADGTPVLVKTNITGEVVYFNGGKPIVYAIRWKVTARVIPNAEHPGSADWPYTVALGVASPCGGTFGTSWTLTARDGQQTWFFESPANCSGVYHAALAVFAPDYAVEHSAVTGRTQASMRVRSADMRS